MQWSKDSLFKIGVGKTGLINAKKKRKKERKKLDK